MKKIIITLTTILLLTGCTSKTEFGECIGIADEKKPDKVYKVSGKNIALAIIFSELIAPPIIVLMDETSCPVGNK